MCSWVFTTFEFNFSNLKIKVEKKIIKRGCVTLSSFEQNLLNVGTHIIQYYYLHFHCLHLGSGRFPFYAKRPISTHTYIYIKGKKRDRKVKILSCSLCFFLTNTKIAYVYTFLTQPAEDPSEGHKYCIHVYILCVVSCYNFKVFFVRIHKHRNHKYTIINGKLH